MLAKSLALTFALGAAASAASAAAAQPPDLETRLSSTFAAIDETLAASSMPGIVIGVTDRQAVRKIFTHGYADVKAKTPITAESRFALGSISKSFTAVAFMQLMDERRFDPQAPIKKYLPWFTVKSKFPAMTGRDLLSHTAGLPTYLMDASSSRYAAVELRTFEPGYAPGAHFWYSNTGYQLLGYVLEDIEKQPLQSIIARRVLKSLGMNSSATVVDDAQRATLAVSYQRWPYNGAYLEAPWFEYAAGDGSIVSNATDMCAYLRFILNRGVSGGHHILSERAFAALTTPVLDDYAYGFKVIRKDGKTTIGHAGEIAGFDNLAEAHPDDGFGLIILSNSEIDPALKEWVIAAVTAAYRGEAMPARPATLNDFAKRPDPTIYAGAYRDPNGGAAALQFVADGADLFLKRGNDLTRLASLGTDTFRSMSHADYDASPFFFARAEGNGSEGKVTGVSHGADWLTTQPPTVAQAKTPSAYHSYVGHYDNHSPEGPSVRIFIREGKLMALIGGAYALPLAPVSAGIFRLEQPDYSPDRFSFDALVQGRALRLRIAGVPFYRVDTP